MTTPVSFDDSKGHDGSNIRKILELSIFLGRYDVVAPISSLTNASGQLLIPTGYIPVGMTSKDDGVSWSPDMTVNEVMSYGYGQAVRRDTVSRTLTMGFTMQESKRQVFEAYYGIDLSQVKANMTTREIKIDQPDRPDTLFWRVLAIGKDGDGNSTIYHAEHLLRATLTDVGEKTWNEENEEVYPVTLSADYDSAAGTSQRTFWAGPGMTAGRVTAMGFTVATS